MFFSPLALSLFSKLGYGDWTADARRWEQWSVKHFFSPIFGGGALNIVQHVTSGIMYPRGHNGLDAWSLLWYEPWAADRRMAVSLWKECTKRLDWEMLAKDPQLKAQFEEKLRTDAAFAKNPQAILDFFYQIVRKRSHQNNELHPAWRVM